MEVFMTVLEGGANIYGIPVGVLSLESYFAKPPGHIKNAGTYFAPLIQQRVNLPVFDIVTLTNMVYQAVVRKPFGRSIPLTRINRKNELK
jgi:hypothetical protein